ncbi:MAG: hypothetical protein KGM44_10060 [bacterium]|nr:hypothetical protein [bacterium]
MVNKVVCTLGLCGAGACSLAMFAVPLGIVGAGVAAGTAVGSSMHGMESTSGMAGGAASGAGVHLPAWVTTLNRLGPELLIVSVLVMIAALALRRARYGIALTVVGGAVLYYGMYVQSNMTVMGAATVFGLALLVLAMLLGIWRQPRRA